MMPTTTTPGGAAAGIPNKIEPLDELACEHRGQILDTDGVEPLDEGSGPQQLGDRFAGFQRDRHQHALGVGGGGVDEHVVRP